MKSTTKAKLYLRDSAPAAARIEQQKTVGRLQALEAAGDVDEFVVESWPTRVTMGTPETVPALATFEEFSDWARAHGASLHPAFDQHASHSLYTGTRFTTTVFPVMCLAVYENDELRSVYPHARQGRPTTICDGIAMLESGDSTTAPGHEAPSIH